MKKKHKKGQGRHVKEWPQEKVVLLKKLYPKFSNEHVAEQLGATVSSVRNAAIRFKIKKANFYWDKPWEDIVLKSWDKMSWQEIAELLKRKYKVEKSKWAIYSKYRELSLKNATKLQK